MEQKRRIIMEYLNLNNGKKIPAAGIGTFLMQPHDAEAAVTAALNNGYELIDTANAYMNDVICCEV
jgi:diketogulonate reductase-like aldo/keto reductase